MEIARTHDSFYLGENRKSVPKECFKFSVGEASEFLNSIETPKIADVGCATGDFLFYLSQEYPNAQLTGVDISTSLLDRAAKEVPNAKFVEGNIEIGERLPETKFDAVFMTGVHPIFDEIESFLNNIINLVRKGGRIYIFGPFNPLDVDVLLKVRYSDSDGPWEAGWNLFSKRTISTFLKKKGCEFSFKDWNIDIDLPFNPDDHFRSWTKKLDDGSRMTVNGMQSILTFGLLEIRT